MALNKMDIVDVNLNTGKINRSFLSHTIGLSDNNADSFGVRVFRDGEPVDLSGGWVQGFFRNPMGENIALTEHGTIDGNVAYVTLPQACYNYEGQFTLAIKIVSPGSANTVTMRIVDGMVDNTNVGGAVAPTETVPTYQEVLAVYDDMLAATTAATTAATNVGSIVAAAYSTSATYAVGDYCTKDGNLYRCTTAITTAESWTAAHWTQTKMGSDVSDLKSAFASYDDSIIGDLVNGILYLPSWSFVNGNISNGGLPFVDDTTYKHKVFSQKSFKFSFPVKLTIASGYVCRIFKYKTSVMNNSSDNFDEYVTIGGGEASNSAIVPNDRWFGVLIYKYPADSSAFLPSAAEKLITIENIVGNVNRSLYETHRQVVFNGNVSGTRSASVDVSLSEWKYSIDIDNVSSNDTDSTTCMLQFYDTVNSVERGTILCKRGEAIHTTIKLTGNCNQINFYASNTSGHSTGDTFTFTGITIQKYISDVTLTEDGGFADAKAVGDEIGTLSGAIGVEHGRIDLIATENVSTFPCTFVMGYISSSGSWIGEKYRIRSNAILYAENDITFNVASGYAVQIAIFNNLNVWQYNTTWKTDTYTIPAGTYYVPVIRKNPEDTTVTASLDWQLNVTIDTDVAKLKTTIDYILETNQEFVLKLDEVTGTRLAEVNTNIPAGSYNINIGNVVSSDTDSTACAVIFASSTHGSLLTIQAKRTANNVYQAAFDYAVDTITFYASNSSSHATGDTFTFTNVTVLKPITDATLTKSGAFADAKAVGDEIETLSGAIDDLTPPKRLNVAIFGDSIFGNDGEIVTDLQAYPSYANVYNCAFGGTCVSNRADTESNYYYFDGVSLFTAITTGVTTEQDARISSLSLASRNHWATIKALDFSTLDLIVFAYGTNDYWQGKSVDTINSAYNSIFAMLRTTYPTVRMLVLTPIWRLISYDTTTSEYIDSDTYRKVSGGPTLREIADGIITNCKAQRVSVYDSYSNVQLCVETVPTFFDDVTQTGDEDQQTGIEVPHGSGHYYSGVHLNATGNNMYAQIVNGAIASLF